MCSSMDWGSHLLRLPFKGASATTVSTRYERSYVDKMGKSEEVPK